MKKMMMALAALCVAGAASALDISWTDTTAQGIWSSNSWSNIQTPEATINGLDRTSPNAFTIDSSKLVAKLGLTAAETVAIDRIIMISRHDSEEITSAGNFKFEVNGVTYTATGRTKVGTVAIGDRTCSVYKYIFDGIVIKDGEIYHNLVSAITSTANAEGFGLLNYGSNNAPTGDIVSNYNQNGNLGAAGQYEVGIGFHAVTVPEPTALALLALGVAGLALRRRAA